MNDTLSVIQKRLTALAGQVQAAIPNDEPFGNVHGNWAFPGLTRKELVEEAQSLVNLITEGAASFDESVITDLQDYDRRLQHLANQTVPQLWGNSGQAVSAYMLTLAGLRRQLERALRPDRNNISIQLRRVQTQLRGMEARLREIEPRTTTLTDMVGRIEQAYEAADQLPADLETLSDARKKIRDLERDASREQALIGTARLTADDHVEKLEGFKNEAEAVLQRCETAYSAATSVGLAAAFSERSGTLSKSMWAWVAGLIVALIIAGCLGSLRISALASIVHVPQVSPTIVALNVVLSVLSIGAPVWFAWLATKQIGQRFRLAEDYAFKASVSRAYEGYRREAARIDPDMEARLLGSALTRIDELPLRLVEPNSHGSPLHELASSEAIQRALKLVPGFANQVSNLAQQSVSAVTAGLVAAGQTNKRRSPKPEVADDDG